LLLIVYPFTGIAKIVLPAFAPLALALVAFVDD